MRQLLLKHLITGCVLIGGIAPAGCHSTSPCSQDLITIESQPDVPLSIKVDSCEMRSPQSAWITYNATNTSQKPIRVYNVCYTTENSDRRVRDGEGCSELQIGPPGSNPLLPGMSHPYVHEVNFVKEIGKPEGSLVKVRLFIGYVDFVDGTEWKAVLLPRRQPIE